MSTAVHEGGRAPALSAAADDGSTVAVTDAGRWTVLFFYPKDDTSGCTTEAVQFTKELKRFKAAGARILGVSKDSVASHCAFRDKHDLGVTLLSDADGRLCGAFDVIREKNMYGRTFLGIERTTFLIAPGGRVARVWRRAKADGHAGDVLEALKAAQKTS